VSGSAVTFHFPARLFGLPHDTRPSARRIAQGFTPTLASWIANSHPQAAVYGTRSSSTLFLVAIAKLPAAAKVYTETWSAGGLRAGLLTRGVTDARRFPAGRGVTEACGHQTQGRTTAIWCVRHDTNAVGLVVYFYGATATSLSEVAAKTNRVISASGG
jgi:hypothetical protein